jgi:NitT/TauT family transport system ATP-binding protein
MSLEVQDLEVTYQVDSDQSLKALENINLSVKNDEFVTLIGPSGCGKSTLLHSLGGLLEPTAGDVFLNGERVSSPDPWDAAFVFQDYSLFPWKTIIDNVSVGLRFAGWSKAEQREKALETLALVGLTDFQNSYPHQLSGGMQQRVAVARAMAMEPKFLLMDEPFGALDEQTRRSLGQEMSRIITANKKGVVMVTHSLDEAIFWADRIVVMSARPGRIVKEIVVPVPRPRDLNFIASTDFASIRAELFELISDTNSEVIVPDGASQVESAGR